MKVKSFKIGSVPVGLNAPLFLMAGPCVIETKAISLDIANRLAEISSRTGIGIIYKASFDKANRSSISSFRGPGLEKGLEILAAIRDQTKLPVMTDVHLPEQAEIAVSDSIEIAVARREVLIGGTESNGILIVLAHVPHMREAMHHYLGHLIRRH